MVIGYRHNMTGAIDAVLGDGIHSIFAN